MNLFSLICEKYINDKLDKKHFYSLYNQLYMVESDKSPVIIIKYDRNRNDVNDIYNTMTTQDKIFLAGEIGNPIAPKEYASAKEYGKHGSLLFHVTAYVDNTPVAFADVFEHKGASKTGELCMGTRNGKKYRRKGYATVVVTEVIKWFKKESNLKELRWYAHAGNIGSIELAKKCKFKKYDDKGEYKGEFVEYDLRK